MRCFIASATVLVLLWQAAAVSASSPVQAVFQADQLQPHRVTSAHRVDTLRRPFGRFLHITDLHPDPHYKHGSAVSGACHHKKPKKSQPEGRLRAGWWGTALTDCDSPPRLVESSLAWASRNLAQSASLQSQTATRSTSSASNGVETALDFIIWTGDSARHDNDNRVPRSSKEIFELNRWVLSQLESAFPGVPLVPTVGNNDIFPHNILFPGPNAVTKEYVQIWQDHIPEYEFHTFEQGGYYVKEILPNRLAAMSLNTLYFYDSNKAVDGCVRTKRGKAKQVDPGTAQLDWLEVQLNLFRQRGMQVHLLGHVPPTAGNYFDKCYRRYTDIVLRFQDTVVGQHFSHMNTDAFFIQEDEEEAYQQRVQLEPVHVEDEQGLPADLKQDYSTLPGKGRTNQDMYSVFYIAPSVIPTYYPSIRLWTYNTTEEARYASVTELLDSTPSEDQEQQDTSEVDQDEDDTDDDLDHDQADVQGPPFGSLSRHHHRPTPPERRKGRKHKKKKRKPLPRHASPNSPSRTNTYLSLLGYSQWVMDIDEQNKAIEHILDPRIDDVLDRASASAERQEDKKKHKNKHTSDNDKDKERKKRQDQADKVQVSYRLEYVTYTPDVLWAEFDPTATASPGPVPKHLLEQELHRAGLQSPFLTSHVSDDTQDEQVHHLTRKKRSAKLAKPLRKFTDYSLPSVTITNMMDLARRLMVDKKLWKRFKKRIYSESGYLP